MNRRTSTRAGCGKGKRRISLFLSLILLFSALSFSACAYESREQAAQRQQEEAEAAKAQEEASNAEAYQQAEEYLAAGQYDRAIRAFEALGSYRDSAKRAAEAREAAAEAQLEEKNAKAYAKAESLLSEEDYAGAMAAFEELGDYRDSAERAQSILLAHPSISYSVGDLVTFGHYEQDDDEANGKEAIVWQVLDIENNRLFLISSKILETRPYHLHSSATWETCTLRSWLNEEFLNAAFLPEEQKAIPIVLVQKSSSREFDTDPGNDTFDKVFVLGTGQLTKYSEFSGYRTATAHAKAQGCSVDQEGYTKWWLRTPGGSQSSVIAGSGGTILFTERVNNKLGVLPALWVELTALPDSAMLAPYDPSPSSFGSGADLHGAKAGDLITFGSYEQDNNTANGAEPIVWQVLEKEEGRILVVSEKALDWKQYHSDGGDVTWEACSLRAWLNGEFLNTAFSKAEQDRIPTVNVSMDRVLLGSDGPGNDTQDKVFLLSLTELSMYFDSHDARRCVPSAYTVARYSNEFAAIHAGAEYCLWWLRTPADNQSRAVYTGMSGSVSSSGHWVSEYNAVRPALWISLDT